MRMLSATAALFRPAACADGAGTNYEAGGEGLEAGDWVVLRAKTKDKGCGGGDTRGEEWDGAVGGGWPWRQIVDERFDILPLPALSPYDRSMRVHEWVQSSPPPTDLAAPSFGPDYVHHAAATDACELPEAWVAIPPATPLGFPSFVPAAPMVGATPCGPGGLEGFLAHPPLCTSSQQDLLDVVSECAQLHCEALISQEDSKAERIVTRAGQPPAERQDANLIDFLCARLLVETSQQKC